MRPCNETMPCCRRPFSPAPRHSCAIWRRRPASCSSERVACTSATSPCPASSAIPIADFHLLPGTPPDRETVLEPGDLITHVTLPPPKSGSTQVYLKLRDRASYEFALSSAAVVITLSGAKVSWARVALGGVGTK